MSKNAGPLSADGARIFSTLKGSIYHSNTSNLVYYKQQHFHKLGKKKSCRLFILHAYSSEMDANFWLLLSLLLCTKRPGYYIEVPLTLNCTQRCCSPIGRENYVLRCCPNYTAKLKHFYILP